MALISCPDCAGQVSDAAPACIHCGRPARKVMSLTSKATRASQPSANSRRSSVRSASQSEAHGHLADRTEYVARRDAWWLRIGLVGGCLVSLLAAIIVLSPLASWFFIDCETIERKANKVCGGLHSGPVCAPYFTARERKAAIRCMQEDVENVKKGIRFLRQFSR